MHRSAQRILVVVVVVVVVLVVAVVVEPAARAVLFWWPAISLIAAVLSDFAVALDVVAAAASVFVVMKILPACEEVLAVLLRRRLQWLQKILKVLEQYLPGMICFQGVVLELHLSSVDRTLLRLVQNLQ